MKKNMIVYKQVFNNNLENQIFLPGGMYEK